MSLDLLRHTFGRLKVMGSAGIVGGSRKQQSMWRCACLCGTEVVVAGRNLKSGHTQSCGCLRREIAETLHRTHGRKRTKEYEAWMGAKTRCFNHRRPDYPSYGAIGRTMAPEWVHDFPAFFAHIGRPAPSPKHSLDRWPNNDGNYEPGNVRWATSKQQANNRRKDGYSRWKPRPKETT